MYRPWRFLVGGISRSGLSLGQTILQEWRPVRVFFDELPASLLGLGGESRFQDLGHAVADCASAFRQNNSSVPVHNHGTGYRVDAVGYGDRRLPISAIINLSPGHFVGPEECEKRRSLLRPVQADT